MASGKEEGAQMPSICYELLWADRLEGVRSWYMFVIVGRHTTIGLESTTAICICV